MKHSDIAATSGTTVQISDPQTGMYLDVTFLPGQAHHALRVLMHGKTYVAHLRLIQIETNDEHDLVASLRVPGGPSDAPPVRKDVGPHPATVLKPQDRTRAAVEGARANPLPAPHPATVQRPQDVTRAAQEAVRVADAIEQQKAPSSAPVVSEEDPTGHEMVMSPAEVTAMQAEVADHRAKLAGGQMGALEPLVDSQVDMHGLDEHPMSDAEIAELHADAAQLRDRSEAPPETPGEAKAEYIDEPVESGSAPAAPVEAPDTSKSSEGGKKSGKGGKITVGR